MIRYVWRHIPTGKWGIKTFDNVFPSNTYQPNVNKYYTRREIYDFIINWNMQQPNVWAYCPLD